MIINKTKEIIKKYRFYNKKSLGQNFLINPGILSQIISASNINPNTNVIEIGTGLGTLTEELAKLAKRVISFEVDQSLKEIIEDNLKDYSNIKLYYEDFLKADLQKIIFENFGDEKAIVVANLPYYITTPIIFRILDIPCIEYSLVMVQKEVALRLTGKPSSKDYNALSVYMKYKTNTKLVAKVSKKSFYPSPEVDSALLHIESTKNDYGLNDEPKFLKFVRDIFSMRRKTLANNITGYNGYSKKEIEDLLTRLSYSKTLRSEELSLDEIIKIYKELEKDIGKDN